MASLDILCFNPFNLRNKIMKIENKKYFMAPTKTLCPPPSYILNVQSLKEIQEIWLARKVHVIIFFNQNWKVECWKNAKQGSKTKRWEILVLKSQDMRTLGAIEYCSTLFKTQKLGPQVAYYLCKIQKLINRSVI